MPPLRMCIKREKSDKFNATCNVKCPQLGVTQLKCVSITTDSYVNVRGQSVLQSEVYSNFISNGD